MLDAGLTLEPERMRLVERFQEKRPENWTAADLSEYRKGMDADASGVPQKLVYGSDFPYRGPEESLGLRYDQVGSRPSFAKGGLSNVWGAAMMPYLTRDLEGWPFKLSDLSEHYEAVLRFTGLAASTDDLERHFPLFTTQPTELAPSLQARTVLEHMGRHRNELARHGLCFGRSRLAVRTQGPSTVGCVYCRLCMYGCPYGYIYSSADTLSELQTHAEFEYQPGVVVSEVAEEGETVVVSGNRLETWKPLQWGCKRAFIAAGAIPTTRILLKSLRAFDQTVYFRDSQYFLLPLLLFKRVPGATREWLHALSQVFIEVIEPQGLEKTAHIQLYSYNDLIGQAVDRVFGLWGGPLRHVLTNLKERILIAQGFLHSDHSSQISARLTRQSNNEPEHFELKAAVNPAAKSQVRKIVRKLFRNSVRIGAIPFQPMLKIAEPGRSFHFGGSFPMSEKPRDFQTDRLGRLAGWKRVHAVDATIFPSIPGTTITLTVMANAHRIGTEAE